MAEKTNELNNHQTEYAALMGHRFFTGMPDPYLKTIAMCAVDKRYPAGSMLGREGTPSDHFFALIDGRVGIETYQPARHPVVLQTLQKGDIIGWSWLFPPYQWVFDARAITDIEVLAIDARCLRGKCEADTAMGYDMMKRLSQIMTQRLKATRMQLLDLYGNA